MRKQLKIFIGIAIILPLLCLNLQADTFSNSKTAITDIEDGDGDSVMDTLNNSINVSVVSSTGGGLTDAELRATPVPVSGTVTVTDGAGALNVIVDSSALPSGASTAAKQPALGTAGTASADVITVQGIATMTPLTVDGSGVTQPVSGSVTAVQATATNLKTQAEAYQGGSAVSSSNPLQVSLANTGTNASAVVVDSELSTAGALGDATSNPTTSLIGAMGEAYNGTGWDRLRTGYSDTLSTGVLASGLMVYGASWDRAREAYTDSLSSTGVLAAGNMVWNGTTFDRWKEPSGDTASITGFGGVSPMIYNSISFDRLRSPTSDLTSPTGYIANANTLYTGSFWDRARTVNIGDGVSSTGIAANGLMLYNGASYDRTKSASGDTLTGTGLLASGNVVYNGTSWDRLRSASGDAASATGISSDGNVVYNGTSWDRTRSVTNGQNTTGTGIQASGILGQLDDVSTGSVTENQFAPIRLSSRRAMLVEGVASGTAIPISAASGAFASGSIASGALASGSQVDITNLSTPITPATATATKAMNLGAEYRSTLPTWTNTQQGALQVGTRGSLHVELFNTDSATAVPSGSGTAAGAIRVELPTNGTGLVTTNPATAANWGIYAEDAGETAGGNLMMSGSVRRDTAASSAGTTGDNATLNTDASGLMWSRTIDPCSAISHTTVAISQTASTKLISQTASKTNYICGGLIVAGAAEIVNFVEGTGSTCGTSTAAVVGSTTAGNGLSLAANGGFVVPATIKGTGNNLDLCLTQSGSNRVSGYIDYVQA